MSIDTAATRAGYRWCRRLARSHYENFPVASLLLPGKLRDPVAAIYAFARSGDDIADEGDLSAAQRLAQLDGMEAALRDIDAGQAPDTSLYLALADTIRQYRLPLQPFYDLLSAFRQDVSKKRYANFGEVMDYCRCSANPIGRLLLHLSGNAGERNLAQSDAVCSALQLINFLQDISQDYQSNKRIYLPADEMARFRVSEAQIAAQEISPGLRALVQHQARRAARLKGRFGLELRAIILGGSRVLEKICRQDDPYSRPRLQQAERLGIAWKALYQGFH